MPVHPERLDERHRRRDAADELVVGRGRSGRGRRGDGRVAVPVALHALEQAHEPGLHRQQLLGGALEQRPPLVRNGGGVVQVLLQQQGGVTRVESVDLRSAHLSPFVAVAPVWATRAGAG